MTMLFCRSVTAKLTDRRDAHGPWLTRAGIRLHLSVCRDCYRYLRQMKAVQAALAALGEGSVAPDTRARLAERFRAWHAGLPKPSP
jgi:hypothetical protein